MTYNNGGRNYVYRIKKHMSLFLLIEYVTCLLLANCGVVRNLFNKQLRNSYLQYLRGVKAGVLNARTIIRFGKNSD